MSAKFSQVSQRHGSGKLHAHWSAPNFAFGLTVVYQSFKWIARGIRIANKCAVTALVQRKEEKKKNLPDTEKKEMGCRN
jgi:hypothetical protein